jgi:hypothetical protein
MSVVATINFQIMGKGAVALGGAATGGEISGPYWNTIQITDPSLNYVSFTPLLGQSWKFVMWGGGVTNDGTLPIATDVSASYLAVAVFAEQPQAPPAPVCPCRTTVTAAPPEPTHESIRVANLVRSCTQTPPSAPSPSYEVTTTRTVCGPALTPIQAWVRQTAGQNTPTSNGSYILQNAIATDESDNQYVASRWLATGPQAQISVHSLDASGNLRWRYDDTPLLAETPVWQGDPTIACLHDPATDSVFVSVGSVGISQTNFTYALYQINAITGLPVVPPVYYTEVGSYGFYTPPLALTTDGAGTLYLASSNAATVFVRSMTMDGTFATNEYWAGLTNTGAAPLVANCYGIHYDPSGYLYLNLKSTETIQGGTRILSPFLLPNTIVVKLTATAITRVWAYQSPALDVTGRSVTSALVVLPNHSVRLVYGMESMVTNLGNVGWAHFSPTGTLVERHNLPAYDGTAALAAATLCLNTAGTRLFYLFWQPEAPQGVSFGELTFAGDITWIDRSTDYNPPSAINTAITGAAATDRHFWIAYTTTEPVQDQTQTTFADVVVVEFALRECFTITETECVCSPIPRAQDFRTVHHQTERNRILREAVRCPLHFHNRDTGGLCASQHAAVHASDPSPYRRTTARPLSRIRGIEEICRPVRNVAASELTARIRSRTESSNAALRRHSEHYRVLPPPRPCRLFRTGPQPGVPIAPITPCIIGNQRVDYSPPTK